MGFCKSYNNRVALLDWMNEWMNDWMNEWLNEWMIEWLDDWMNEWMNDWMIECHFYPFLKKDNMGCST